MSIEKKGTINLVRSDKVKEYKNLKPIYEWSENKAYLTIDEVAFKERKGAVLCYYNPPVHQVGNLGLDAYLAGLDKVFDKRKELEFLVLYGANDPVHVGGDLKESLTKLDETLELKKKIGATASADEIDRLFDWADKRLEKGVALHKSIRRLAEYLRIVAVCGGGTRYGGSAEIPLMADFLVGDSRSSMCFSEATIGLIPGWGGIAGTLIKAGLTNAEYMAKTSKEVKAAQLKEMGIYNVVVDVPFSFPRIQKTGNPDADKAKYKEELEAHDYGTGVILFPKGLELSICPVEGIPFIKEKLTLATEEETGFEVDRRKNPENYSHLWGKPLKEVKDEIAKLGKPLAPQSIKALEKLFDNYQPGFDEYSFVEEEMRADARLYRDSRFREGLTSTLDQRVADYRRKK